MKIWVVGSFGLLGSTLVRMAGEHCIGSSREEADVSDEYSLKKFMLLHPDITHIVNTSAFSLVDLAESEKEKAWKVNALGPSLLGKIARQMNLKIIHISTDYVFDGTLNRSIKEDALLNPLNYYGKTKEEGEILLLKENPDACIIRTSSIFGVGGKNFVAKLLSLFEQKKEIFLSNDQWVRPTYAKDLSLVILHICKFFQKGIYHFANEGIATKFSFGFKMKEILEKMDPKTSSVLLREVPSSFFPSVCKRPVYSVLDTEKIEKTFQVNIRSWEDALEEFLMEIRCASVN